MTFSRTGRNNKTGRQELTERELPEGVRKLETVALVHPVMAARASVFPPTRERDENSRNPFAAASPRDSRRLTDASVWLLFGDNGHRYLITQR
jgi:hypothetical protein